MMFPATANLISDKAGIKNAFSFDMNAACSGLLYAIVTGSKFIETGSFKKVIVVEEIRCRRLPIMPTGNLHTVR